MSTRIIQWTNEYGSTTAASQEIDDLFAKGYRLLGDGNIEQQPRSYAWVLMHKSNETGKPDIEADYAAKTWVKTGVKDHLAHEPAKPLDVPLQKTPPMLGVMIKALNARTPGKWKWSLSATQIKNEQGHGVVWATKEGLYCQFADGLILAHAPEWLEAMLPVVEAALKWRHNFPFSVDTIQVLVKAIDDFEEQNERE